MGFGMPGYLCSCTYFVFVEITSIPKFHHFQVLTADLVVYDKQSKCQLTEGEYELVLEEKTNNKSNGEDGAANGVPSPNKRTQAAWETAKGAEAVGIALSVLKICVGSCKI